VGSQRHHTGAQWQRAMHPVGGPLDGPTQMARQGRPSRGETRRAIYKLASLRRREPPAPAAPQRSAPRCATRPHAPPAARAHRLRCVTRPPPRPPPPRRRGRGAAAAKRGARRWRGPKRGSRGPTAAAGRAVAAARGAVDPNAQTRATGLPRRVPLCRAPSSAKARPACAAGSGRVAAAATHPQAGAAIQCWVTPPHPSPLHDWEGPARARNLYCRARPPPWRRPASGTRPGCCFYESGPDRGLGGAPRLGQLARAVGRPHL